MALGTYGRRPIAASGSYSFHQTFGALQRGVWPAAAAGEEVSLSGKPPRSSCTLSPHLTTCQRGY
jgi:hypothetical protein